MKTSAGRFSLFHVLFPVVENRNLFCGFNDLISYNVYHFLAQILMGILLGKFGAADRIALAFLHQVLNLCAWWTVGACSSIELSCVV